MTSYRKIETEVRDDDISTTISYSKARKEGVLTERVFIKKKNDRKIVSELHGTSVDNQDWKIKGNDTPVEYEKYTPDKLFKEFGFINLDCKKIGGGVGVSWFGWLVIVVIILSMWFAYEYTQVTTRFGIENAEKELWNNSEPAPTKRKELVLLDFWQTADMAKLRMLKRLGMGAYTV